MVCESRRGNSRLTSRQPLHTDQSPAAAKTSRPVCRPTGRCLCEEGLGRVFSRVVIVNRGEAAMRLIHAVRELAAETATPIETVALHTAVDPTATFVREADTADNLGPASARPYLDLQAS